jgi:hypothetical protein
MAHGPIPDKPAVPTQADLDALLGPEETYVMQPWQVKVLADIARKRPADRPVWMWTTAGRSGRLRLVSAPTQ